MIEIEQIKDKLKQIFGHDRFREEQEAIMSNIISGKNTFVIMPTGGGKSLCYQIPALILEGVAIVISPLIALMKDQVDRLHALGVNAAFFNSTLSAKAIAEVKKGILSGQIKLLYVAPESLSKENNLAFLKQAQISFVAVDEAHCISDWGHDFRPEYRKIKTIIKEELGNVPTIALTATATPKVQLDILKNLGIEEATVFQSSFNRKNLYYEIRAKEQTEKQLVLFINHHQGSSGIVYCQSRKKVEKIAEFLNLNNIKAAPYHAGLDANVRIKIQNSFLSKEISVIVATIAFGMGIDKPNVRFVIHYDAPKSLEGYYQETGRAGRDGLASTCLMFYSYDDIVRMQKLNRNKLAIEREKATVLLQKVMLYACSGVCRRKQLLSYFGEPYPENCNYCDNCKHPTATYEGQEYIHTVLTTVQQTQELFGVAYIIQLIQGLSDIYVEQYAHQNLSTFGKGKEQDNAFWQSVVMQTLLHGLLCEDITQAGILKITPKGEAFLMHPESVILHQDRVYDVVTALHKVQKNTADTQLLPLLDALRTQVAKEKAIPPYAVLQDFSLEEMAITYPTSLEALSRISGLTMDKAKRMGAPFIQLINQYVIDHAIEIVPATVVKSAVEKSNNKVFFIQQIDRRIDLEKIAAAKSMNMEQFIKELEQICYSGTKLNLDYYINTILSKEQQGEIYDYFMHAEKDGIKQALQLFEEDFEEIELRLMRIKFLSEVAN